MEPQGRGNVPARHTPERNKRLGLRKTTLESRGHVQTSWAECPRQKKFRHRAEGEIFLLTFPFIGLFRVHYYTARRPQEIVSKDNFRVADSGAIAWSFRSRWQVRPLLCVQY